MREIYEFDIIVVGAGVIGIAIAMTCAQKKKVLLIEKKSSFGSGISSRNSEVIHAGIYYPQNSLKAKFCRDGMFRLYNYCNKKSIPIKQVGKLIVQSDTNDREKLLQIYNSGLKNGCDELVLLDTKEIKKIESEIIAENAIWSPKTGVFDSHQFMKAMLYDFEKLNGVVAYNHNIEKVFCSSNFFELPLDDLTYIKSKTLINCCGLNATNFVKKIEGFPEKLFRKVLFCKGTYFGYQGKLPFNHHIYPVPNDGGLGIHFTLDLNNYGQFGPDTEWINYEDYTVDNSRINTAFREIKKYWPKCEENKIRPVYSGIRPKIGCKSNFEKDFLIETVQNHKIPGLINLLGIESPGLTSALSIASNIAENYV